MVRRLILFGHLGLTAGAAQLCETVTSKRADAKPPALDYRLVLVGSMLPDLLDKPIGAFIFLETFHNSRIFAHTLLFTLALLIAGAVLYGRKNKNAVLQLGLASLFHVLLDGMWRYPETLFWPLLNIGPARSAGDRWLAVLLRFPYRFDSWIETNLQNLLKNPAPLLYELAGLTILSIFLIRLHRRKKLKVFLKTGKL